MPVLLSKLLFFGKLPLYTQIGMASTSIAAEFFVNNKFPEIVNIPKGDALYQKIFSRVVKSRSKLFMFTREKAEHNQTIQELWHYRFIHLVSPSFALLDEKGIPQEYSVFSMDYGKLLSLKVNEAGKSIVHDMLETSGQFAGSLGGTSYSLAKLVFSTLSEASKVGGRLKRVERKLEKTVGTHLVSKGGGVESANIRDTDYLVKNCLLVNLL